MRYEEYKETALKWVKPIPSHWETMRGKNLYQKENRLPRDNDEVVTCFRDGQVTLRKNRRTEGFTESLKEVGYQGIRKGDLVIHVMDAFAGSIGVSDSDGKGTPVYSVCTAKRDLNNYYYAYLLREMARTSFIQSLYRGIRERSSDFRFDVFAAQTFPVPPREEQDQIVRYLDWQLSKINKLIHGYQKQIKLLEERKKALFITAVTKGIEDNAEMKDSGLYWLGSIPSSWKIIRAKYLFKKEKREPLENDDVVTCFRDGEVTLRKNRRTTGFTESLQENGYQHVCKGDLVIHVMDAFAGAIGISDSDGKGTPVYHCCTPIMSDIYVPYYMYFLRMMAHTGYIQSLYRGIRERSTNFTFDVFSAQYLAFPPYEEQIKIVAYIQNQINAIDRLKEKINSQIEFLREYRTRLISDVVTGQMDVRGIEIPDYTPEENTEIAEDAQKNEETEVNTDAESDE